MDDGPDSVTTLWKDGSEIFNARGKANAFHGDNDAYLKFGLYKPHWDEAGLRPTEVSMAFGPITVTQSE
ncbi:hypothetical protein D3C81_2285230 [compost metagenome]